MDTMRMISQANQSGHYWGEINVNWAWSRWKEVHDELTKIIHQYKYPDIEYSWYKFIPETWEHDGVKLRQLKTPLKLYIHANMQHHCAASYSDRIKAGDYCIYEVVDNEGNVSTLGFSPKNINNNQHYGSCNSPVSDEVREVGHKFMRLVHEEWSKHAIDIAVLLTADDTINYNINVIL